jgi:hypothetical protein
MRGRDPDADSMVSDTDHSNCGDGADTAVPVTIDGILLDIEAFE